MPYRNIKLISFDLDNTLYDNEPVIKLAEEKSQKYLHQEFNKHHQRFNADQFLHYRKQLIDSEKYLLDDQDSQYNNLSFLRQKVLLKCCHNLPNASQVAQKAFELFIEYRHKIIIPNEIISMLKALNRRYILVSATNGNCEADNLNFEGLFKKHYSATQGYRAKPHPAMLNQMTCDFKFNANQILHIGDSLIDDGGTAERAGCHFIHFSPFLENHLLDKDCAKLINLLNH